MSLTLSIITPSFNQGKYLSQTIESVFSQKGDFFIDYIIFDGGSTDNSIQVMAEYQQKLEQGVVPVLCRGIRMRFYSENDRGQTHAINKGLAIAKGELLAWLNSDDYYEPGALGIIVEEYVAAGKPDLIYGDGYVVNENLDIRYLQPAREVDFKTLLHRGCLIFQPSAFFTSDVIKRVGQLDERYNYVMDYDLWLRILKNGRCKYLPRALSNFRVWGESKTNNDTVKFKKERRDLYKRYGGNLLDYGTLGEIRGKLRLLNFFKRKFPKVYDKLKKLFFAFIDLFHYQARGDG